MSLITIRNDGMRVTETNYFESEWARRGIIQVTMNDCAFRIFIPPRLARVIDEMRTAHEVVVTGGTVRVPGKSVSAYEFMFEDGTRSPLAVTLGEFQVLTSLSPNVGPRADLRCLVYTQGPTLSLDLPARYRTRKHLPCLKAWTGS